MRNEDFRKMVSSTAAPASPSARPSVLGAKTAAFVATTPRPGTAAAGREDAARPARARHDPFRPRGAKKFKSVAPKGSRLAAGYTDRAKARQEAEGEDEDDRAKRIQALEEQVKLGRVEQATFEALRDEIAGGDVASTHLVKGLDRKLLERVRRGEDVFGLGGGEAKHGDGEVEAGVDEELDELGAKEVETVRRETAEKTGVRAPLQIAGKKRTRDEIVAELKAQRKAAAEAKASAAPALDSRWRRVGDKAQPKVEIDRKGREVVTITNEDGTVRKMVRKATEAKAAMPAVGHPVLGADVEVPEQKKPEQDEDSDDDIFSGVGTEYDPLGGVDDDDDSDEEEKPAKLKHEHPEEHPTKDSAERPEEQDSNPALEPSGANRNYFGDSKPAAEEQEHDRFHGIENVLKKATHLRIERSGVDERHEGDNDWNSDEERQARLAKRAKMLERPDRDLDDLDMGFGESRFEDEADFDDAKIKLSQWKGTAGDEHDEGGDGGKGGKKEKKRKPKKRKGDANNMADIMRVIDGRKGARK